MKAEIKDGKLVVTPESYAEEFFIKKRSLTMGEWAGDIVFTKYECEGDAPYLNGGYGEYAKQKAMKEIGVKVVESTCDNGKKHADKTLLAGIAADAMDGIAEFASMFHTLCEEGRMGEYPEELMPDKECKEKKVSESEYGERVCSVSEPCWEGIGYIIEITTTFYLKNGLFTKVVSRPDMSDYVTTIDGDCVLEIVPQELRHLVVSAMNKANLERDEIMKKAHEEAGSIKSKAIDHYHEMSSCGADKIADGVREAGRIVREAKENAARINAKAMNVSESIVRTAHGGAEMIVEQANTEAEKIKASCNDGHIEIELERGEYKSTFHFNPGAKVSISKSGDVTLHKKG